MDNFETRRSGGAQNRVWAALILIAVGGALILREAGMPLPDLLFHWPMILIVVGLFVGFKHGFRGPGWLIMLAIGSFFLFDEVRPDYISYRFFWPAMIVAAGIIILIRPRRGGYLHMNRNSDSRRNPSGVGGLGGNQSGEDRIDSSTVLGGMRKTIVSKHFKGGSVNCVLGGTEIDMSQADIDGKVILEINQVMGATKLVVPSHWEIQCNVNSAFGSVEDKRKLDRITNPEKLLVIEGSSVFGGIEIKNY